MIPVVRRPLRRSAFGIGRALASLVLVAALDTDRAAHAQKGTVPSSDVQAALEACVSLTNDYRRTAGRAPLERDDALDAYARDAATHDARAGKAHAYFRKTRGGGVSRAENQLPAWPLSRYGTVLEVVRQGLAMMWAEGPRGPHRKAMADARYTRLGCALVVDDQRVTVVQEFR